MKRLQLIYKTVYQIPIILILGILATFIGILPASQPLSTSSVLAYSGSTNVSTSTAITYITNYPGQRKLFYVHSLIWAFYCNGTNEVYRTSADNGVTWSSEVTFGASGAFGHRIAFWVTSDNRISVAWCDTAVGHVYYRRGMMNAGGTITWDTAFQEVAHITAPASVLYPNVRVDSNGYPWVSYVYLPNGFPSAPFSAIIIKSKTNNGTFTADDVNGFPYTLVNNYTVAYPNPIGAVLNGGKMYYAHGDNATSGKILGNLWNGAAWGATENVTTSPGNDTSWDILGDGDNIHGIFQYYNGVSWIDMFYRERTVAGWQSEVRINDTAPSGPTLTKIDDNNIAFIWEGVPVANHMYYRIMTNGVLQPRVDWLSETTMTNINNTNALTVGNSLASTMIIYAAGSGPTYYVKFADINPLPTTSTLAASGVTTTGAQFNGNVSNFGGTASSVTARFEYGTTTAYGTTTTNQTMLLTGAFSATVGGLVSGTTYHYRTVVTNDGGTAYGNDVTVGWPPQLVTNFIANPSSTSMVLSWTPASGSTTTVVTYNTTGFPSLPSSGTVAYNGTAQQATVSNLTAGTVYFFSAWGYNGATYSTAPAQLLMSTLATTIPSGAANSPTPLGVPIPTLPANALQAPSTTGFNLEPFTSIIAWFNSSPGGLGMPTVNAWETLVIIAIVGLTMMVYIKTKVFFLAYAFMFMMTVFGIGLHLVQGLLAPIEIVIGMGIWAVERYFQ